MKTGTALAAGCAWALAGCTSSSSTLSPTQQDALQTRVVEGSTDRAFAAAADALIDAGYTVEVTDGEGGLLTGMRREDASVAEHAAVLMLSALVSLGQSAVLAPPDRYAVCVQVLPRTGGLSSVRIRCYGLGGAEAERRETGQLWTLMQRHVLISEPVAPEPGAAPHAGHR
jgi:hypothetical protein